MLATATSVGTWFAGVTIVVMLLPIYVLTLKAASNYGRLESKVDAIALAQAVAVKSAAETNALIALSITKVSDAFVAHAVADAQNFGEIKGWIQHGVVVPIAPSPTLA